MSEVSSTAPGQRPPPATTGGPSAVAKSSPTRDQPGAEQEKTDQKPARQPPAQQRSKSYYDPAVSVSPSLAHLTTGQLVEGEVVAVDGEGRPVLRTAEGTFALRPDAGLAEGAKVSIRITESDKSVQGDLIARDGKRIDPPVSLQLTLIGIHPEPEVLDPDLPAQNTEKPAQTSYSAKSFKPGLDKALAYETSSLSLPRTVAAVPLALKPVLPPTMLQTAKPVAGNFNIQTAIQRLYTFTLPDVAAGSTAPAPQAYRHISAPLALPEISYPGRIIFAGNSAQKSGAAALPFQLGEKVSVQVVGNNPAKTTRPPGRIIVQAAIIPLSASPVKAPEGAQILQTPIGHIAVQTPKPLPANQIVTVAIAAAVPSTPPFVAAPTSGQQRSATPETGQTFNQTQAGPAQNTPQAGIQSAVANTPATAAEPPTGVPPAQKIPGVPLPLPALAEDWPFLDDLYTVLTTLPPHIAGELASRLPRLDARLPNTLLFLTRALQIGSFREWAGPMATTALEDAGQEQLAAKLDEEFTRIGRLFADPQADGWRPLPLPLQTDQNLHILAVLVRPIFEDLADQQNKNNLRQDSRKKTGNRFLLEFDLSELGTLQLDGLIKGAHFDLIIRSRQTITESAKSELKSLFLNALQSSDMEGALTFEQKAVFPIIVTDLLTKIHHSDHHENVTI